MIECEACGEKDVLCVLEDLFSIKNSRFIVCGNCLISLINLRLSVKQFKNLIKNGHNSNEFYLHEDFYDEEGVALQPR
jgi:hypothetical protein